MTPSATSSVNNVATNVDQMIKEIYEICEKQLDGYEQQLCTKLQTLINLDIDKKCRSSIAIFYLTVCRNKLYFDKIFKAICSNHDLKLKEAFLHQSFRWVVDVSILNEILDSYGDQAQQLAILMQTDPHLGSIVHRIVHTATLDELKSVINRYSQEDLISVLSIEKNHYTLGVSGIMGTLKNEDEHELSVMLDNMNVIVDKLDDQLSILKDWFSFSPLEWEYCEPILRKMPFDMSTISAFKKSSFNNAELVFFKKTAPWLFAIVIPQRAESFDPNRFPVFQPTLKNLLSDLNKEIKKRSQKMQLKTLNSLDEIIMDLSKVDFKFSENNLSHIKKVLLSIDASCKLDSQSFWERLYSIVNVVLGILAIALVVPALCVEYFTNKGYKETFFSKSNTLEKTLDVAHTVTDACAINL